MNVLGFFKKFKRSAPSAPSLPSAPSDIRSDPMKDEIWRDTWRLREAIQWEKDLNEIEKIQSQGAEKWTPTVGEELSRVHKYVKDQKIVNARRVNEILNKYREKGSDIVLSGTWAIGEDEEGGAGDE